MSSDERSHTQDPQLSGEDHPGDNRNEGSAPSAGPRSALPNQLLNWRVTEVDGMAVPVGDDLPFETEAFETEADIVEADAVAQDFVDKYDDLVVLTVPTRHLNIAPGESGTMSSSLLNNADFPVVFEVTVQGDAPQAWFPDLPLRLPLQPGERQVFSLQVVLPVGSLAQAGTYHFGISASSTEQPERCSRAACSMTIEPYSNFRLGILQPERVATSWWSPSAQTSLPITNISNHEASFRIEGADSERAYVFEFDTPQDIYAQAGQASFTLGPGERGTVGITILSRRQPAVSLTAAERSFRIAVQQMDDRERSGRRDHPRDPRKVVEGRIVSSALVGPWQMVAIAGITAAALLLFVMFGATMLLALRPGVTSSESQPAIAPTVPPAPAFALILSMDEPVPTHEPATAVPAPVESAPEPNAATYPTPVVVTVPEQDGLSIVQAEQVSAPGQATPAPPPPDARPTPVAVVPVNPDSMTYAQMFRQIATRYDLNWRMLAAQGYVESGFDSMAVGRQGSLGLMQIHPATWQEWAPLVDVEDPFDTYGNVLVAAIYLDYLRATLGQQGHPQVEWMLAAYNWGPDKVLNLLASDAGWTDLPVEVQQYAADVLRIAQTIPDN